MQNPTPRPTWTMPTPTPLPIETDRLLLRASCADDADAVFRKMETHRDELAVWLSWARDEHRTLAESRETMARLAAAFDDDHPETLVIAVCDKATGELLGAVGVNNPDGVRAACEVGYWVWPDRQNRGVCTEATRAHLTALFTPQRAGGWGFRRVYIRCDALNAPSAAIPRKLGFRLEGLMLRDDPRVAGSGFRDTLQFAALAEEWDVTAGRVVQQMQPRTDAATTIRP